MLGGCRLAFHDGLEESVAWLVLYDGSEDEASRCLECTTLGGCCLAFHDGSEESVAWLVLYDSSEDEASRCLECTTLGGCRLAFHDGSEESVAWLVLVMILSPSREGRLISSNDSVRAD
jgi:hypothetical protein